MANGKKVNKSVENCDTNDNNSVNNETADRKEDSISVFHEFVRKVETVYDADVYFYNGDIQFGSLGILASLISKTKQSTQKENALLILITLGGDGEAAFRIAKLFQKTYKSLTVYVPSLCKSAGTLLLLGANKILMNQILSELGPLDVQIYDRNSLVLERKTGLQYRNVFESTSKEMRNIFWSTIRDLFLNSKINGIRQISTRDAVNHARLTAVELTKPIISQLNPSEIASDYRNMEIGFEYGKRLAKKSKIIEEEKIKHLIWNYHSHEFPIDKEEASTIFNEKCVNFPEKELLGLVSYLGKETSQNLLEINTGRIPVIYSFSDQNNQQTEA